MDEHSLACLDFARMTELLAESAMTGLGRALAEHVHPVARPTLIQRWLGQVAELTALADQRGMPPFGGISDVREILKRSGPPLRINVEEMARVGATLEGTHVLAEYLRDLPAEFPEMRHLAERVGDFRTIADRIRTVIDDRGQVRDNASAKLQAIRNRIEQAQRDIQGHVARLLQDAGVRKLLQYPNHTFHGDRLVLPVRHEYRGRLPGIVHRVSDSGATLYVEPATVVELNNEISNLRSEEHEEIGRLLWDLTHELHLNEQEMLKTLDTLAVLDLVTAKVRLAKRFEMRCPELAADGLLQVRGARHPLLLELAQQQQAAGETPLQVVPIDYRLGEDFNLLIITGPNTGGKTVTLKTIGLLSLMVQAGLPVPVAEGSRFGVFSHIQIDVGDEQSMQQSLSTFSGHLTRILDMLRHANPRALLLIDELGAGTDPDEGAALGRAILDELLRHNCRGVVTTHLGALKAYALTREKAENACVEFDAETLRPTYHLAVGEAGQSNAIEVAQRLGMPRRMVAAARQNLSKKTRMLHAALEGTRAVKRQAEHARRAAESARQQADKAHSAARDAEARLEKQRTDFQQWLQRVIHLQPGDAVRVRDFDRDGKVVRMRLDQQRAEVDVGAFSVEVPLADVLPPQTAAPPPRPPRPVVASMERKPKPPAARKPTAVRPERTHRPDRDEPRPPPALPALTAAEVEALKPLDAVYVRRFHREGRVVRVKSGKQVVVVNVGALEVEVPYDGLARSRSSMSAPQKTRPVEPEPARPNPPPVPPAPIGDQGANASSSE